MWIKIHPIDKNKTTRIELLLLGSLRVSFEKSIRDNVLVFV